MLTIENLNKSFGSTDVLHDINLNFSHGEIIGLFGENGAGKSTLMKCILGYYPCKGKVLLDGKRIDRTNIDRLSFATVEHSFFPNLSTAAHAEFYQEHFPKFNERRFKGLMEFFGLPAHRAVGKLSTGQKNQIEVILALSQGADYILMDEPFSGNDLFNREDFYKMLLGIMEPHETLILATHLIEEVESFISRAVLLRSGHILGDVTAMELEDRGQRLTEYVKEAYGYRADRVSRAIDQIAGEEG